MWQLDELKDWCTGETALIICGGTDAPVDVHRSDWQGAHWISVNQHAALLPDLAWCYAHDAGMISFLRNDIGVKCPIASPQKDYLKKDDIHTGICPWVKLSGPEAVWCADWMGYEKIFVCGVDNYKGNTRRDYWHQYVQETNDESLKKSTKTRVGINKWNDILPQIRHIKNIVFYNHELIELQRKLIHENSNH